MIVTNSARRQEVAAMAGLPFTPPKYIGWGIGTAPESRSDTALSHEIDAFGNPGTNRGTGGVLSQITTTTTGDTLQIVQTLTSSTNFTLTEVGWFDAATGGNLFVRSVFSGLSILSGGSMQIIMTIQKG